MSKYPECEKLSAVTSKSRAIGEFLDWLEGEKQLVLAQWNNENGRLYGSRHNQEALLAEFFDIDLKEVEKERRAMLEDFCSENRSRTNKDKRKDKPCQ